MKNILTFSLALFLGMVFFWSLPKNTYAAPQCYGVFGTETCADFNASSATCSPACTSGEEICCDSAVNPGNGSCGNGGTCKNTCISGTENPTSNHPSCTTPGQTTCCEPASGSGGTTTNGSGDDIINLNNPTKFGTVEGLISTVLRGLQGVIITLALIFLVVGAILYLTSGGSEERITLGKKAVIAALIGFAIAIGAPSFLHEISAILEWSAESDPSSVCDANQNGSIDSNEQDCVTELNAINEKPRLAKILLNVLSFLLGVFGTLSVIVFVVAGVRYLFSGGSEDQIDSSKRMVTWAIVGIIVAFGALVIVRQVAKFFLGQ